MPEAKPSDYESYKTKAWKGTDWKEANNQAARSSRRPQVPNDAWGPDKVLYARVSTNPPNRGHAYSLNINSLVLSGVICKPCAVVRSKSPDRRIGLDHDIRRVWTRIKHMDYSRHKLGVDIALRFDTHLAEWAYNNLAVNDQITVVGHLFEGLRKGLKYPWIDVEVCTPALPVMIDLDPRYVRVRRDAWNRIHAYCGDKLLGMDVPKAIAEKVLAKFEDVDPYEVEEPVEFKEPSKEPEP